MQWYTQRNIPFAALLASYKKRAYENTLPETFTALVDSYPVGMASLKENDLWSRKDINPWLSSVYVLDEFRNSGIGSMLIDAVIKKADEMKYSRLYLFLGSRDNSAVENYYMKRGWLFSDNGVDNDGRDTKILVKKIS